ncbi:MAG: hypothetical protein CVU18_15930 [Betaproteobacteria bacterium HGW-Betaproteobacteria-12]|nr:MAG: hypothetical protein CVU18_15930 [Betaproteobacteria bacterium HGW-Betaproteobacteria-12]
MPNSHLWAGALSQLLIHDETGCPQSARHATLLLNRLCAMADLDAETRALCERASRRLENLGDAGGRHAGTA